MWRHVQYSPSGRMQPTGALRQSWLLEADWQTQGSSFAAVDCRHARLLGVAQRRPQQPSLPGSAESAADIKLSCWRGALGQRGLNTPVLAQWSTHPPARWKTGARTPAIANTASCPRQHAEDYCNFQKRFHIRGSIVVSISACHAEDPGSIPGRGDYCLLLGAAAREHVAPCAIFSIRLHAAD